MDLFWTRAVKHETLPELSYALRLLDQVQNDEISVAIFDLTCRRDVGTQLYTVQSLQVLGEIKRRNVQIWVSLSVYLSVQKHYRQKWIGSANIIF